MTNRRAAMLVLAMLVPLLAACGAASQPNSPDASASAPTAAAPTPAFTTLAGTQIPFGATPVRNPAGWHVAQYLVPNSFYQLVAFLGPEILPDPCLRKSSQTSCQSWPQMRLPPDGIVVSLWEKSFPGWSFDPSAGENVVIGGQRSTFATGAPDEGCRAIGGDEQIVVTIPSLQWNWWELDACLSAPDHGPNEALVRQMLGDPVAATAPPFTAPSLPASDLPSVQVENSTSLDVTLVINDVDQSTVAARTGTQAVVPAASPPLPWHMELRSSSGRVLLALDVPDNLVGRSARVDLSCGVLSIGTDVSIGGGPTAGAGSPGDCEP